MPTTNAIENRLVWPVLDIGTPFGTRLNRTMSEETREANDLTPEAGGWRSRLYPKKHSVPLTQLEGRIRRWYYKRTASWDGQSAVKNVEASLDNLPQDGDSKPPATTGMRVMPVENLLNVETERNALQSVWDVMVKQTVDKWDEIISDCVELHKGTFNARWYPAGKEAFRRGFTFSWDILELPGRGHWLLDLPNSIIAEMEAKSEARSQSCLAGLKRDIMGRLLKPLTEFAAKLKGGGDFQVTRWERLEALATEVSSLNVDRDPVIVGLLSDLSSVLAIDPQACRESATTRAETADAADSLAKTMANLFG